MSFIKPRVLLHISPKSALVEEKPMFLKEFVKKSESNIAYIEENLEINLENQDILRESSIDGILFLNTGVLEMKSSEYPIITESELQDSNSRESFLISIYTVASFRDLKKNYTYEKLLEFHTNNKYLFMSYNQTMLKELGRLIANHIEYSNNELLLQYEKKLRKLLQEELTKEHRINMLSHVYGYFKNDLNNSEKDYYFEAFNKYINNQATYLEIINILESFSIKYQQKYLLKQTIFQPFPEELLFIENK
jgi:uncharacterized protein YbgA (DUF1722 family)